jgi:hypothetical protein
VNDAGSIYRWKKIMPGTRFTADMHRTDSASGKSYGSLPHFLQVNRAVRIGMLNNPLSGGNRNGLQKIRDAASAIRPEVLQR